MTLILLLCGCTVSNDDEPIDDVSDASKSLPLIVYQGSDSLYMNQEYNLCDYITVLLLNEEDSTYHIIPYEYSYEVRWIDCVDQLIQAHGDKFVRSMAPSSRAVFTGIEKIIWESCSNMMKRY